MQQIQRYNEFIAHSIQTGSLRAAIDPFADWAVILTQAAADSFTPFPLDQRKPYMSDSTWHLLCQRQAKLEANNMEEALILERQIRKQVRKDKRQSMQDQLEEIPTQGYQWS